MREFINTEIYRVNVWFVNNMLEFINSERYWELMSYVVSDICTVFNEGICFGGVFISCFLVGFFYNIV